LPGIGQGRTLGDWVLLKERETGKMMMKMSLRVLRYAAILAPFMLVGETAVGQAPSVSTLYVNAEQGDDTNSGSQLLPFLTLNKALEAAWVLKQPVGNPPTIAFVEIKVVRTDTPIAPLGWGGEEWFGWQTPAEMTAGTTHKAFPLRMVKGVDVIGVTRNGQKPRILIDETITTGGGAYPATNWEAGLPKSYVWMASNVELRGFLLSGDNYVESRATHSLKAVYARNVTNAIVDSCEIWNFHDGVFFDAEVLFDAQSQQWEQEMCTGSIRHSVLHDFFPVAANPSDAQDKGHAAVWLVGPGVTDVDLIDVEIIESHDALEVAGVSHATSGLTTTATVDITDCDLHDVENGAEVVGVGTLTFSINETGFTRCKNIDSLGTPASSSVAGLALRGMSDVHGIVRDSRFENNAYSILWGLTPTAPSLLDMGTSSDLGHNVFLPFDFNVALAEDVYRVHLFQKSNAGVNSLISAVGNTWIPGQQGAHATTGCMAINLWQGIENLPNSGVNDGPPGPFAGQFQSPGVPWKRNFSVLNTAGWIDFGSTCP
jgi:hypothetical protein